MSESNDIKCWHCGTYNPPGSERCSKCGALLSPDAPNGDAARSTNLRAKETVLTPKRNLYISIAIELVLIVIFSAGFYSSGLDAAKNNAGAELESINEELAGKQQYVSNLNAYIEKKDSYDSDMASMQSALNAVSSQTEALKNAMKQTGSPIKLPAGQFTVGKDIPSGRYSVTGDGNFYVDGKNDVNTILSDKDDGLFVSKYICTLTDGDRVETNSATTFTPVS